MSAAVSQTGQDAPPRRARSLLELGPIQAGMFPGDELEASIRSFRPRASDIVIAPFVKCGTTWLQQAFHTLRTGGDLDFDDISRVVPWIETARALGLDLDAPQKAEPRGFKSHLPYDGLPKGARCVVAFRDPKDALISHYKYLEGWFFEPGTIAVADFVITRLRNFAYWHHLTSWWGQRDNPSVLLLSYEQMSADPELAMRRLARFCGIPLDRRLLALTLERTSLAWMLAHKDKFDDRMVRELTERRGNLPRGGDSAKVRAGKVGGYRTELPPEIASLIDAMWREMLAPEIGFADYPSFEADVRRHAESRGGA